MIDTTATHYRVEMETSHHKATKPAQHWVTVGWHSYKADAVKQCRAIKRGRVVEVNEWVIWLTPEARILTT